MRPIKIVGTDTDLHDYQVRIHLDRSNFPLEKCKPDGSDIRFRDDSGEILPYWIERWNAAEGVIWCKIPFIPAESSKFIWMIYGNPNAKPESNGNVVFELFDVQGIVGFWHFDEPQWTGATGEVKDETGVNHGTAYGGATTTSDAVYGRAGLFDGSNGYVDCGKDDSLDFGTDDFSVELWFKANSLEGAQTLIGTMINSSPYKGWFITNYTENTIKFHVNGEDGGCPAEIDFSDTANLHHIVGVRISTGVSLYLDGVLKKTTSCAIGNVPFLDVLLIGARPKPVSTLFNGIIDEVRIYNRALSPTEIQILSKNYMQKMGSYFNVRKYVTPAPVVIV